MPGTFDDERGVARVVAQRHARTDEMRVREREYLHVLAQELLPVRGSSASARSGGAFDPAVADEVVEHGGAPVERAAAALSPRAPSCACSGSGCPRTARPTRTRRSTGGCVRCTKSQRCHETSPPFATADEVEATSAASARPLRPGSRRGARCGVVSPARTDERAEQDEAADDEAARRTAQRRGPAGAGEEQRASAGSGRRAATASATASAKPKTAVSSTARISAWTRGSNGVRTS